MDFQAERKKRGWTLEEVAQRLQGRYKPSTINGLETRGEGSERLKRDLEELYGIRSESTELREGEDLRGDRDLWRRRAKTAEKELTKLRDGLRRLLESPAVSSSPASDSPEKIAEGVIEHFENQPPTPGLKPRKPSRRESAHGEANS